MQGSPSHISRADVMKPGIIITGCFGFRFRVECGIKAASGRRSAILSVTASRRRESCVSVKFRIWDSFSSANIAERSGAGKGISLREVALSPIARVTVKNDIHARILLWMRGRIFSPEAWSVRSKRGIGGNSPSFEDDWASERRACDLRFRGLISKYFTIFSSFLADYRIRLYATTTRGKDCVLV